MAQPGRAPRAEADLLSRGVLVGRRKATKPHPLLTEYRALLREQRAILNLLGLKRRAKPVQSLAEITAELVQHEQKRQVIEGPAESRP